MENHEKWMELCALASKEQDSAKLLALTQEIACWKKKSSG
jgi:hypothetical protein